MQETCRPIAGGLRAPEEPPPVTRGSEIPEPFNDNEDPHEETGEETSQEERHERSDQRSQTGAHSRADQVDRQQQPPGAGGVPPGWTSGAVGHGGEGLTGSQH